MRTVVDIDPDLHRDALDEAVRSRVTMSSVVNDALRKKLRPAPPVAIDDLTGLGVVMIGSPVTAGDVADLLDD